MAKTAQRRKPVRRKSGPAKKSGSSSGLALSGWLVATGLGVAWSASQLGIASLDAGALFSRQADTTEVATVRMPQDDRRPVTTRPAPKFVEPKPTRISAIPAPRPQADQPARARSVSMAAASDVSKRVPQAEIPRPTPVRSVSVNLAPDVRPKPAVATGSQRSMALPVRQFPYVTAKTIATVGDLRGVRILGGQGDWKKVELSEGGQIGWLQLKRYVAAVPPMDKGSAGRMQPPPAIKPASLPSEDIAGRSRAAAAGF